MSYKKVFLDVIITVTANGTGATALDCPLPIAARAANESTASGRENAVTGNLLIAWLSATTSARIQKYDSSYPAANGYAPAFFMTYELG